jgi:protein SCO1/2
MNRTTPSRRDVLAMFGALACTPWLATVARAADAPLPGDSVYQLQAALTDQDGRAMELASLRGSPVLTTMFYTSCEMVCPMLFETIRYTLQAVPAAQREQVRVLMISFDPARDTVPVLKKTARDHGCDARWTLARCSDDSARQIAAALGIQYRQLASGEYNHSSTIELLDRQGRIAARTGQLGSVDKAFVKAIRQAVAARA